MPALPVLPNSQYHVEGGKGAGGPRRLSGLLLAVVGHQNGHCDR